MNIAAWLAILPPDYATSNDFARNPVGTGPYAFGSWSSGEAIELSVNEDYFAGSPKGTPIADAVTYRFVPDATTIPCDWQGGSKRCQHKGRGHETCYRIPLLGALRGRHRVRAARFRILAFTSCRDPH